MTNSKAVIFDLDDTLYPERDYVASGFKAVAAWAATEFNVDSAVTDRELHELASQGTGSTFDRWLAKHKLDSHPQSVQLMVRVYRDHVPRLSPFASTKPLLSQLVKDGYRIGLVSDGYLEVQQKKFAALQLESHFDAIVFSDELGRDQWKPSPAPFQLVLERLGMTASSSVYVGDNPKKDFIAPRLLGMSSCRLRTSGGVYNHLAPEDSAAAPDFEIQDLAELPKLLSTIFE